MELNKVFFFRNENNYYNNVQINRQRLEMSTICEILQKKQNIQNNQQVNTPINNPINNSINSLINNPTNNPINKPIHNTTNNPINNPINNLTNNPISNPCNQQPNQQSINIPTNNLITFQPMILYLAKKVDS